MSSGLTVTRLADTLTFETIYMNFTLFFISRMHDMTSVLTVFERCLKKNFKVMYYTYYRYGKKLLYDESIKKKYIRRIYISTFVVLTS